MKIWAHRGCSQTYPENTITAFSKAIEIEGLTGIELDIQMAKDGEIVVIHDERVDRTTSEVGYVKDFTYLQLKKLTIDAGDGRKERIPSIIEVLDLLQEKMKMGFMLNIELKNSEIPYHGMEDKILNLIAERNLQKHVVYSSFNTQSLKIIKDLEPDSSIGILDTKVSDCLYKKKIYFGMDAGGEKDVMLSKSLEKREYAGVAVHPFWRGIDLTKEQFAGQTVRAWFSGHLYPEKPTGTKLDLGKLESMGVTDVFLNEPERYV